MADGSGSLLGPADMDAKSPADKVLGSRSWSLSSNPSPTLRLEGRRRRSCPHVCWPAYRPSTKPHGSPCRWDPVQLQRALASAHGAAWHTGPAGDSPTQSQGQAPSLWSLPSSTSFPKGLRVVWSVLCHSLQSFGDRKCWEARPLLGRLCTQKTTKLQQKPEEEGKDVSVFYCRALGVRLAKGVHWKAAWHPAGPGTQGLGLAPLGRVESGAGQGMGRGKGNQPARGHPSGTGEKLSFPL